MLPKYLWRLPWHHGRFRFDCVCVGERYTRYRLETVSAWAPVRLDLDHLGARAVHRGFPDDETAEVVLTHPLKGYYFRSDGRLGSYSIWHDRLTATSARVREARFGLLDRLGLVPYDEQRDAYSVLVQPSTEFVIRLPPRPV